MEIKRIDNLYISMTLHRIILTKKISYSIISKDESLIFKGLGIFAIMLHNYFRWVHPVTGESEFFFNEMALPRTLGFFLSNPLSLINVFFNYFGHYGVQIFVFISAYGLTRSYKSQNLKWQNFISGRFFKFYPSFFFSVVLFLFLQIIISGSFDVQPETYRKLGVHLSLLSTVIPEYSMAINGPWWFYSMIFQLYIIFPFLLKIAIKKPSFWLLGIGVFAFIITNTYDNSQPEYMIYMSQTCIGQLPVFCLGIFFGTREKLEIPRYLFFLSVLAFILGSYFKFFWPLSQLAITIVIIFSTKYFLNKKNIKSHGKNFLIFIGSISLYLFAMHGILRTPFYNLANDLEFEITSLVLALVFLLFSVIIAYGFTSFEKNWRFWINSSTSIIDKIFRSLTPFLVPSLIIAILYLGVHKRDFINSHSENMQVGVFNFSFDENSFQNKNLSYDTCRSSPHSLLTLQDNIYSDPLLISIDPKNSKNLLKVEASIWNYSSVPEGEIYLVVETKKKGRKRTQSWDAGKLIITKNETNKWVELKTVVELNRFLDYKNTELRVYLWNKNGTSVYSDDLIVSIFGTRVKQTYK